ncbi:hypothetical protein G4L39_06615 [Limisphaera ngatamarikiensis]|uniref:Uncharacterized protein n=1 Tax=Limisphaera ngatamarikiensis TaxID=1324935 RepID=A0A6M1RNC7_9BACT|nr:hypothetical protein [Limisphaera ngatamarikiensis]NGO39069.1 hypothetical protein [Limisphaera ngatamarikiensis]
MTWAFLRIRVLIWALSVPELMWPVTVALAEGVNHMAPGNVFLEGEPVRVWLPAGSGDWALEDYDGRTLRRVKAEGSGVELGRLPIGFYRLRPMQGDTARWISLAVLGRMRVPPGPDSPIGVDVAMSWFYEPARMEAVARLCRWAGVVRVRDRMRWAELEPGPAEWAGPTRYDVAARVQREAGLQVLQVVHDAPAWAGDDPRRFPGDLRVVRRFWREISRRWAGQVTAFEPWNEADIPGFGGHTGSEMATYQKAAWWGIRSGAPETLVCWNVFAGARPAHLADLDANVAWPFFDTYNFHHYEPFERYPELYRRHRAVSAGRPMWVTECAWPVRWSGDAGLQELSEEDLRLQAERVVKTFVCALHEGAAAVFYFLLPHYVEGPTQFGLLRRDLTPRPGYVALAAVGRWLAGARPVGRMRTGPEGVQVYVFRARPDGDERDVAVVWSDAGPKELTLPGPPLQIRDVLGRLQPAVRVLRAGRAPQFVVFRAGRAAGWAEESAPARPVERPGQPSPVVLQAVWPAERVELAQSAYRVAVDRPVEVPIRLYHFGSRPVRGRVEVRVPEGWEARFTGEMTLAPGEMREEVLQLRVQPGKSGWIQPVRLLGRWAGEPDSVLSFRVMPVPVPARAILKRLPRMDEAGRWRAGVSGAGRCRVQSGAGGVEVVAEPAGSDPWFYPELDLEPGEFAPADARGVTFWFRRDEGRAIYRLIAQETSGAAYVLDLGDVPAGEWRQVFLWFDQGVWGAGWSRPDPNGRLDAAEIRVLKLGGNGPGPVRYEFRDWAWIRD